MNMAQKKTKDKIFHSAKIFEKLFMANGTPSGVFSAEMRIMLFTFLVYPFYVPLPLIFCVLVYKILLDLHFIVDFCGTSRYTKPLGCKRKHPMESFHGQQKKD